MRMVVVLLASVLFSLTIDTPLHAEPALARLQHPFQEVYQKQAPVSGSLVAGILITTRTGLDAPIALHPPAAAAGSSVCVQVMSRDGRYWSKNNFALPDRIGSDPVPLEYPTQRSDYLSELDFENLAVLSFFGDCADAGADEYLPSSRGRRGSENESLIVFVNSARAETYIAVGAGSRKIRPTRCRTIQEGRRTSYDTLCIVPIAALDSAGGVQAFKIMRRRYERWLPAERFSVKLPASY